MRVCRPPGIRSDPAAEPTQTLPRAIRRPGRKFFLSLQVFPVTPRRHNSLAASPLGEVASFTPMPGRRGLACGEISH